MSEPLGSDFRAPLGQPDAPYRAPTIGPDVVGAALRQSNPVVSVITALQSQSQDTHIDPEHNPIDTIGRGSKYEQFYLDRFLGSRNENETRQIMANIDREDTDRETLAASGTPGTVVQIGAGLLDPTLLLPAGGLVRAADGSISIARSLLETSALGGLGVGVSEAALQASQETRSAEESLINIGTGTVLAGLLGGAVAGMLGRAERKVIEDLTRDRVAIAKAADLPVPPHLEPAAVRAETEAALGRLQDEITAAKAAGNDAEVARLTASMPPLQQQLENLMEPANDIMPSMARSAGAAAADERQLIVKSVLPQWLKNVVPPSVRHEASKWIGSLSPSQRMFFQYDTLTGRRAMADLIELAFDFEDNAKGITTTSGGAPIARAVHLARSRIGIESSAELTKAFQEYRFGKNGGVMQMAKAQFQDMTGKADGAMSFSAFKTEVSRALRNGDTHEIPQVQQVAQYLRQNVFAPIEKRLVDAGLLDKEGVAPKGDTSYFHRVWNKEALIANRNDARKVFADWLESEDATKARQQARVQSAFDQRKNVLKQLSRIEGRIERAQARAETIGARLDERGKEAGATAMRAETLADRTNAITEEIGDLEEFVGAMRQELSDPEALERLRELEDEVRELKRQGGPLTETDLRELDRAETAGVQGDTRIAAEIAIGRRNRMSEGSLLAWVAKNGGVADTNGDVRAALGDVKIPGLVRKDRIGALLGKPPQMSLDDWGEKIASEFNLPERLSPDEVLRAFEDAKSGKHPWWWTERNPDAAKASYVNALAAEMEEMWARLDRPSPGSLREVARWLNDGEISADEWNRAADAAFDSLIEKAETETALKMAQQARDDVKGLMAKAEGRRATRATTARVEGARAAEAGSAANRNARRLNTLLDQADRTAMVKDLLEIAKANAKSEADRLTKALEDEVRAWKGNSAAEALSALKKRDEQERLTSLKVEAGVMKAPQTRYTGADRAVDRFAKRLLKSERGLTRAEHEARADEILDRIIGSPDGRLPYDVASGGAKMGAPDPNAAPPRGALQERDFAIPSNLVQPFLENDVEHVLNVYTRTVLPDLALHERFGDVEMKAEFRKLNEEYAAKIAAAPEKSKALEKEKQKAIRDLAAIRDRVRGTYGWNPDVTARRMGELATVAKSYNVVTDLGSAPLNSMGDLAGIVYQYGIGTVLKDAWLPFFKSLSGTGFAGEALRQAKAMQIAVETETNLRSHALSDVLENHRPGTKFGRGMQWMADKSQIANMQAWWTDRAKAMASAVAATETLRSAKRVATGAATAKDIERLAQMNIDQAMARRIHAEIEAGGGNVVDGIMLPNTGQWQDASVRQAFEAAIAGVVDRAVVTPGLEKPLIFSNPILALLGQFKSFTAASHERILIPALQRRDAQTLQGLVASAALGMVSYKLYSVVAGRETSSDPSQWIKEGISRGGALGWLDEANNSVLAKLTSGELDMYRLVGAEKPLTRFEQRSAVSALLGPTVGKLDSIMGVSGAAFRGEWSQGDTARLRRLAPYQNLWWLRNTFNAVEDGANQALGVPERAVR